jgi:hypothetical protein
VADDFMKDGKGDVRYLIQGADGKDISPLSYFAREKEVLPHKDSQRNDREWFVKSELFSADGR